LKNNFSISEFRGYCARKKLGIMTKRKTHIIVVVVVDVVSSSSSSGSSSSNTSYQVMVAQ
jgi:hypothetical protein